MSGAMDDVGAIDRFLDVFSRYIDTGFGLVRGDVAALAQILVALDVTLAALFWAWGPGEEILARLVKKTLYVGAFAFLLGDFQRLAQIVFDSFAGLGLKASAAGMTAADLLRPGHVAAAGVAAIRPILEAAGELDGFPAVFENLVQIVVLLAAAGVVLLAFFVLAVQLFVTVLEFKLTTLAGFILVPFGLFGRTAFLAERVLGAVMAAGVKVLVLAVIVGIGAGLFEGFAGGFGDEQPTLDQALAVALGALTLLGLGIFGPGVASGLVSGGPQLGAGAAVGATAAAGGVALAGISAVRGAAAMAGGAARLASGAASSARSPRAPPGGGGPSGGGPASGPPRPGPSSSGLQPSGLPSPSPSPSPAAAASSAGGGGAGPPGEGSSRPSASDPPSWARRLQAAHAISAGVAMAAHAVRSGDGSGGATAVPLSQETP